MPSKLNLEEGFIVTANNKPFEFSVSDMISRLYNASISYSLHKKLQKVTIELQFVAKE
jgi:hypothetical protein